VPFSWWCKIALSSFPSGPKIHAWNESARLA
jgi:hypothetical protein